MRTSMKRVFGNWELELILPIVNTQRLFVKLLSAMQIDAVCDVGSMNGADAMNFREAVPDSTIYAFEPNPDNLRLMYANRELQERNIRVVPLAVTNFDGEAEFFIVEAAYSRRDARRGMSSLYRRTDEWAPAEVVRVGTTRLDTFLSDKCPPGTRVALWIDTEGKAYEVIESAAGIAGNVDLLHVEVETTPCIGSNQKLYPQVKALLQRLGYEELARDQAANRIQFNALFVRADVNARRRLRIDAWVLLARLRYLLVRLVIRLCPGCARRYHAMRQKA